MKWLVTLRSLVGMEAARWAFLGVAASIGLSGVEYAFALILQVLLLKLSFASSSALPDWMLQIGGLSLLSVCLLLSLCGFVRVVFTFLAYQSACVFSHTLSSRLRLLTAYELLLSKDGKFLSSATISNRMGEIFPQAAAFASNLVTLLINGFQILALLGGLFFFAWKEAILGLISLAIIGGPVVLVNKRVRRISGKLPAEQEGIFKKVERVTKNWLFVRISRTQTLEHARLSQSILRYANHALRSKLYANLGASLPTFLGILVLCGIILISQAHFQTSVSSLVAFLYLYIRFTHQISLNAKVLTSMGAQFKHFSLARDIVNQHSSIEMEKAMSPLRSKGIAFVSEKEFMTRSGLDSSVGQTLTSAPSICLRDVTFSWSDDGPGLLNNFSAEFRPGAFVGIVGPSGVGKSTLLQLVLGMVEPKSGSVFLGDMKGSEFLSKFSQSVGYVGPEPFLVDGDLRENLLYGNRLALSDEDLWSALHTAQLIGEVKNLPLGLGHRISELGEGLSMGQKQRLMLARAFLRKPKLLILDEVSANLDIQTELKISDSLSALRGSVTILAVSHRDSLLRNADYFIRLLGGGGVLLTGPDAVGPSGALREYP